jgi:hypothetical protein
MGQSSLRDGASMTLCKALAVVLSGQIRREALFEAIHSMIHYPTSFSCHEPLPLKALAILHLTLMHLATLLLVHPNQRRSRNQDLILQAARLKLPIFRTDSDGL